MLKLRTFFSTQSPSSPGKGREKAPFCISSLILPRMEQKRFQYATPVFPVIKWWVKGPLSGKKINQKNSSKNNKSHLPFLSI
jgi:hypothetical protein